MPSTRPTESAEMTIPELATSESNSEEMSETADTARPRLTSGVRMRFDAARDQHVLLSPEAVLVLNPTGAEIVELCDGERTITEIRAELRNRYGEVAAVEVRGFLDDLIARRGIELNDD